MSTMSLNSLGLGLLITGFQEESSQHSYGHQMADSNCQSLLTLLGQSSDRGPTPKSSLGLSFRSSFL